jgi:hypothetical protein
MQIKYIKTISSANVPFKIWKCNWFSAKAIRIGFGFGFIEIYWKVKGY